VTIGSIHGGTKSNVIPDEVKLELTVRSYTDEVRQLLIASIEDMARETCNLFGCPRPPDVWIKPDYTPAMFNDPDLVARSVVVFQSLLGDENVIEVAATMTGEDFGRYTRHAKFPTFLYRLGSVDPKKWEESGEGGEPLPSLHSSRYFPDAEATLRTGLRSMSRLALSLLGPPAKKN
jgi:metal-dependent amidase/aminoacylase/carboxypeptidase family protein